MGKSISILMLVFAMLLCSACGVSDPPEDGDFVASAGKLEEPGEDGVCPAEAENPVPEFGKETEPEKKQEPEENLLQVPEKGAVEQAALKEDGGLQAESGERTSGILKQSRNPDSTEGERRGRIPEASDVPDAGRDPELPKSTELSQGVAQPETTEQTEGETHPSGPEETASAQTPVPVPEQIQTPAQEPVATPVPEPEPTPEPAETVPAGTEEPKGIYDYPIDVEAVRGELIAIGQSMGLVHVTEDDGILCTPDTCSWAAPVTASESFQGQNLKRALADYVASMPSVIASYGGAQITSFTIYVQDNGGGSYTFYFLY